MLILRFTWADTTKLIAQGDKGMGLLWTRTTEAYELVKPRKNGGWESALRSAAPLCFKGLEGSEFRFDDTWDWYELNCGRLMGRTYPAPDGTFTKVKTTTATSYTDTKATAGKTYYYKVTVCGLVSESAQSGYKSIRCKCAAPTVALTVDGQICVSAAFIS